MKTGSPCCLLVGAHERPSSDGERKSLLVEQTRLFCAYFFELFEGRASRSGLSMEEEQEEEAEEHECSEQQQGEKQQAPTVKDLVLGVQVVGAGCSLLLLDLFRCQRHALHASDRTRHLGCSLSKPFGRARGACPNLGQRRYCGLRLESNASAVPASVTEIAENERAPSVEASTAHLQMQFLLNAFSAL